MSTTSLIDDLPLIRSALRKLSFDIICLPACKLTVKYIKEIYHFEKQSVFKKIESLYEKGIVVLLVSNSEITYTQIHETINQIETSTPYIIVSVPPIQLEDK